MKYPFLIFLLLPIKLFSQMSFLHPNIPSDYINDMHFINENEIILINDGGNIYKSYDAGMTFELKKHYPGYSLCEMHFIDDQTGFIKPSKINYNNLGIIYTEDAGETWNNQPLSIGDAISFIPLSKSKLLKSTSEGDISLLDNFYNNWQTPYLFKTFLDTCFDCGIFEVPYGYIQQFEKLPSGSVLALGTNGNAFYQDIIDDSLSLILNSSDAGYTWDTTWTGFSEFASEIAFNDDSLGWMNIKSSIFKTTNTGISWTDQNVEGISNRIEDLVAINNDEIYAITEIFNQQFIKSVNSGESWEISDVSIPGKYNIAFNDATTGFLYGSDLLSTNNAGDSWNKIDVSTKADIYDIDFISLEKGFALGREGLFITYNGGYTWDIHFYPEGKNYNNSGNLTMLNETKGWLVTNTKMYKTEDGGLTWILFNLSDKEQRFQNIEFYDENLGILYSVAEEIAPNNFKTNNHYITNDGGESWNVISIASDSISKYPGLYKQMQFTDPSHLWAINQQGLWLSADTAKTWQHIFEVDYFIGGYSFDFYNSEIGIITRTGDFFYFTNDGGDSWQTLSKSSYNNPNYCKILGPDFSNRYRAIEVGKEGTLLQCNFDENGIVYYNRKLSTYTANDLNKIFVFEQDSFPYVWIGGNGFSILYRQWELINTGINNFANIPDSYSLEQNYPNPYNPTTMIKFYIETPAQTKLVLYNILGQKIADLVNEFKNVGSYEVKFTASDLPSGIYLYHLKSGSYSKSRRMLLFK